MYANITPSDKRFVQEVSLRPTGSKVVTFTNEGTGYLQHRRQISKTSGALFIDATGDICQKVKCNTDEPAKCFLWPGCMVRRHVRRDGKLMALTYFEKMSTCGKETTLVS